MNTSAGARTAHYSVEGLLLDLDGTLVDDSRVADLIAATCQRVASSHPRLDARVLRDKNASIWHEYWAGVELAWALGDVPSGAVRTEAWRRTLAAAGCDDEAVVAFAAETHADLGRDSYRLFDDVVPLLDAARTGGVATAIVTNGASDTQREKLDLLGLTGRVDAIIVSAEVGMVKPEPRIFELALQRVSASPALTWHVGDSLTHDVAGAQAIGIHAAWLNRRGQAVADHRIAPDVELTSLREVPALLAM